MDAVPTNKAPKGLGLGLGLVFRVRIRVRVRDRVRVYYRVRVRVKIKYFSFRRNTVHQNSDPELMCLVTTTHSLMTVGYYTLLMFTASLLPYLCTEMTFLQQFVSLYSKYILFQQ